MSELPCQTSEATRLSRLAEYRLIGTDPEPIYDRITRLAALCLGTPMAAIGIMDAQHIWFKARIGMEATELPHSAAICADLAASGQPLIIPDTLLHPAYREMEVVRASPAIRFFVAIPLRTADGLHIGGLCVMDCVPHPHPSPAQIATLQELATLVMEEFELRRLRDPVPATLATSEPATTNKDAPSKDAHRNLLAAYTAKSEFLTSLSHELRTPLNAIAGYAGLIATEEANPSSTTAHAQEIIAAARHMLALVNDILEYSRLEAGNLTIGWQRVTLAPVVEAALRMVAVFAASRGVRLHRDIAWPQATLRGDPVRLKQVLLNLLTNAIKFTPRDGQVTVRLARHRQAMLILSVSDTGIGIAEADIAKALIPFGQVIPQAEASIEGTGLGLPIAKALIERQGGSLHLESQPGQGTTVRILLPAFIPHANAPVLGNHANLSNHADLISSADALETPPRTQLSAAPP